MEKIKRALHHATQVLKRDVFVFRQIILQSEGGDLPPEIVEKQKLIRELEAALLSISNRTAGKPYLPSGKKSPKLLSKKGDRF
jgi:hypothetical protein